VNSFLLAFLIIVGFMALYWVLFGQWKHNKMMREIGDKEENPEQKK